MNMPMGVTLNFDATNVEPNQALDPIPSGWYNAKIIETKMEPTSKPGGQMLALTLEVLDGQYQGRKLFDRLNLVNDNPVAVEIAYKTLSAISRAVGVMQVANSNQLHNIPLKVKAKYVGQETGNDGKTYDPKNEVKGYDHINSDHTTAAVPAGVVGGVAGAPAGTPPWAAGTAAAPAAAGTAAAPAAAAAPPAQAPQYAPPVQPVQVAGAQQPWQQPGAAAAPPAQAAAPAAGAPPWQANGVPAQAAPAAPAPAPVAPAPAPPAPVVAGPQMLPAATTTYDEYIKAGWSDEMLIQNGLMAAPVAAAPAPHVAQGAPQPATAAPGTAGGRPPWATA